MTKIEVTGFNNRGTAEHPFGFIEFTDGLRIGYSPGARGTDEDGLFNPQQPFLAEKAGAEIRASHVKAAREYVRTVLQPVLRSGQHRLEDVAREGAVPSPPGTLEITPEAARQMLADKENEGDNA